MKAQKDSMTCHKWPNSKPSRRMIPMEVLIFLASETGSMYVSELEHKVYGLLLLFPTYEAALKLQILSSLVLQNVSDLIKDV